MTEQEYTKAKKSMLERHEKETGDLHREYAIKNNPYLVGSIVKDQNCTIRIEKILIDAPFFSHSYTLSSCIFEGPRLRASDLEPVKSGEVATIYQRNVKELIK